MDTNSFLFLKESHIKNERKQVGQKEKQLSIKEITKILKDSKSFNDTTIFPLFESVIFINYISHI